MSSSDIALSIQGVSKCYMIAPQQEQQHARLPGLGQRLREALKQPARKELFWALRDISFDVNQGDVIGIIGRNGAGKSTLLKILSRITEPTTGCVELHGRVGSLLEVGTGFHPELTGRENVFLNGAILGMSRAEISRRFDEIVEFSGVEKFLDTPVKRYSSGMYVRLAFAVAAHLEPEILIVDEVLAVGDAEFQKKCIGKMHDVAALGTTILLVSHNLSVVSSICTRGILMERGLVTAQGYVAEVVSRYRALQSPNKVGMSLSEMPRTGLGNVRFERLSVSQGVAAGNDATPEAGRELSIEIGLRCYAEMVQATVAAIIYDASGFRLIDVNTALRGQHISLSPGQSVTVTFDLTDLRLLPGEYLIGLWVGRHGIEEYDSVEFAATLGVPAPKGLARTAEIYPGPYTCDFDVDVTLDRTRCVPGGLANAAATR